MYIYKKIKVKPPKFPIIETAKKIGVDPAYLSRCFNDKQIMSEKIYNKIKKLDKLT